MTWYVLITMIVLYSSYVALEAAERLSFKFIY